MKRRDFLGCSLALAALAGAGCRHPDPQPAIPTASKRNINFVGLPGFSSVSPDGRYAAFMEAPEPGQRAQAQVFDARTRDVRVASVGPKGVPCDGPVASPSVSADGSLVVFTAKAANLGGPADKHAHIYLASPTKGVLARISATPGGVEAGDGASFDPIISPDGAWVVYFTKSLNLTRPPLARRERHLVAWNRARTETVLLTAGPDGTPANGPSGFPAVSRDSRFVAFESEASNLGAPENPSRPSQIYVRDLQRGALRWIAGEETRTLHCSYPDVSNEARVVVFEAPWQGAKTIFRVEGDAPPQRITPPGTVGYRYPSVSADGRFVVCSFVGKDGLGDAVLYDHQTQKLVTLASQVAVTYADRPRILADGSAVWVVADPVVMGEESLDPSAAPSVIGSRSSLEVVSIANPFLQ